MNVFEIKPNIYVLGQTGYVPDIERLLTSNPHVHSGTIVQLGNYMSDAHGTLRNDWLDHAKSSLKKRNCNLVLLRGDEDNSDIFNVQNDTIWCVSRITAIGSCLFLPGGLTSADYMLNDMYMEQLVDKAFFLEPHKLLRKNIRNVFSVISPHDSHGDYKGNAYTTKRNELLDIRIAKELIKQHNPDKLNWYYYGSTYTQEDNITFTGIDFNTLTTVLTK